jgi:hypothetical protein
VVGFNHEILNRIATDAVLPSGLTLEDVNKQIALYPAFSSLYLVKALLLKNTDSEAFEKALPEIAARVHDRAQLFDLVFRKQPVLIETEAEPEDEVLSESIETIELKEEVAAVQSETITEEEPETIEALPATEIEQPLADSAEIAEEQHEEETVAENLSFADWLKRKAAQKAGVEKVEKTPESSYEPVPIDPSAAIEAQLMLESKQTMDQLDMFVSDEILKKKSRKQGAKSALNNSASGYKTPVVTETFAEILVMQKKYEEAIETYKALSLKYPQKSSYFATRIEKIKNYH